MTSQLLSVLCGAPTRGKDLDDATACQLDPVRMKAHVDALADDQTHGRIPGSIGHALARDYLLEQVAEIGLQPFDDDGDYLLLYDNDPIGGRYQVEADGSIVPSNTQTGQDIVALLPGSDPDLADEYLVVMAHYDHLGVTEEGAIFNGAFDNAAGVAAALEVARVLVENDAAPARSTVFLLTDDEESGLDGAAAWLEARLVDADDVVMAVSADPLGRALMPAYAPIVIMGLERSPTLKDRVRALAEQALTDVVFLNRDVVPVFSSDQDRFYGWETGIPAAWFTNIGFAWYHTVDDTAETIDYDQLLADPDFLAQIIADVGSDGQRYEYIGPVEPAGQSAADAITLFEGILGSSYPDVGQQDFAQETIDQLQPVVDADDSSVVGNPDTLYYSALAFVMYSLAGDPVGVVPPPWPEHSGCD